MLAKVNNDQELLEKSRILGLERALSEELIPSKKEIVRDNTQNEIEDLIANSHLILDARVSGINDQLSEQTFEKASMKMLSKDVMNKVKVDKENF